MSDQKRLISTIAAYKDRYGDWPIQVRVGPQQIVNLVTQLGDSGISSLSKNMDLRVDSSCEISVGGLGVIHYGESLDRPVQPRTRDEVRNWLGLDASGASPPLP